MRTTSWPFISALKPQPTPQYAHVVITECSAWPIMMTVLSCRVEVGQACTQAPQDTHSLSRHGWSRPAAPPEAKPLPEMVRANVPWVSSQARTQRLQTMHLDGSYEKYGFESSVRSCRWLAPSWP